MTATAEFPATGVLPADEEEALAAKIAGVLADMDTLEDMIGTCPTRLTEPVEEIAWALYERVWRPRSRTLDAEVPPVEQWICESAYGGRSWFEDGKRDAEAVAP